MARTLTGNSARREQRLQEILLDRLVAKYERRVQREIARAMASTASKYSNGDPLAVDTMVYDHKTKLSTILTPLWLESARTFSEHIASGVKSLGLREHKQDGVPPTDAATAIMINWIRSEGVMKLTQITTTTQNDLRDIISSGLLNGLSEREIAKNIRSVIPSLSGSRASTITRTETHGAANISAQATADATGLNLRRQWVASGGERTRPTHATANGQIVGMNETFTVGGVSLAFPGDPSANTPSETVNCRCAVVFVV